MEKGKVLITDHLHESLPSKLALLGYEVVQNPEVTNQDLLQEIHLYKGIVITTKLKIDQIVLNKATELRFVARAGSGMENVDVEYAKGKGIHCINTPQGNSDAVGEHAIAMILGLLTKVHSANMEVKNGLWNRELNRGIELKGKTVGIVGYGNTGSAFAKKLRGFEVETLAYDKYKKGFSNSYVKEVSLEDIQGKADIISVHLPLNNETSYFISKSFIDNCRRPFYLINTARGKIVNTKDLLTGLNDGKVIGTALDVLEEESSKTFLTNWYAELKQKDNVILTPHVAGWTHESKERIADMICEGIRNLELQI